MQPGIRRYRFLDRLARHRRAHVDPISAGTTTRLRPRSPPAHARRVATAAPLVAQDFYDHYVALSRPVVLRGIGAGWRAARRGSGAEWTNGRLRELLGRERVDVRLTSPSARNSTYPRPASRPAPAALRACAACAGTCARWNGSAAASPATGLVVQREAQPRRSGLSAAAGTTSSAG
jgi:hypothetical protein